MASSKPPADFTLMLDDPNTPSPLQSPSIPAELDDIIEIDTPQSRLFPEHPTFILPESTIPTRWHYGDIEAYIKGEGFNIPVNTDLLKWTRLGYDPQELLYSLSCQPCRPSNLEYKPKLNIFYREKFPDVPDHIFNVIKPALALAERMILQGNPKIWIDVACGRRELLLEQCKSTKFRVERLHPADYNEATKQATFQKLQCLGDKITYSFEDMNGNYGDCGTKVFEHDQPPGGFLYPRPGKQPWINDNDLFYPFITSAQIWNTPVPIRFHELFYTVASNFAKLQYPDTAAQLRFNFFFAGNLCHELIHGLEAKCNESNYAEHVIRDRQRAAREGGYAEFLYTRSGEALYKKYPNEMGMAWEYDTLGARLAPINCDIEMRYGIQLFAGADYFGKWTGARRALEGKRPIGRALPLAYMEELQQTSFWEKTLDHNGIKAPNYGPVTYILPSASTYSWRQCLLDQDPDYAVESQDVDMDIDSAEDADPESSDSAPALDTTDDLPAILCKSASDLKYQEKWLLFEEYACIIKDWTSHDFLTYRKLHNERQTQPFESQGFPAAAIPGNPAESWDEAAMQLLRDLRLRYPERTLAARKQLQQQLLQARLEKWKILAEMEEYVALNGLSRIQFMRQFAANQPLYFGMTIDNWAEFYRPHYLALKQARRQQEAGMSSNATSEAQGNDIAN